MDMDRLNDNNAQSWNRLKANEIAALHDLYAENYVALMNYGLQLFHNRELVRDAVVQVLLNLWNKREKLPDVQNVRSYLITCIRREVGERLEKERARQKHDSESLLNYDIHELSYEDYLIQNQSNQELKQKLKTAILQLTKREKELLKYRFFESKTYEEIAQQCNITTRTAYNIIHQSIVKLRESMVPKKSTFFPEKPSLSSFFWLLLANNDLLN